MANALAIWNYKSVMCTLSNDVPNKVASECKQTTKKIDDQISIYIKKNKKKRSISSSHQRGRALYRDCFLQHK